MLAPSVRNYWLEGQVCPVNGEFPITFLLESAIAGDSQIIVNLKIDSILPSE